MSKRWNLRSQSSQDYDLDRNRFPAAQPISVRDDLPECIVCVDRDNQIYQLNQLIINLTNKSLFSLTLSYINLSHFYFFLFLTCNKGAHMSQIDLKSFQTVLSFKEII